MEQDHPNDLRHLGVFASSLRRSWWRVCSFGTSRNYELVRTVLIVVVATLVFAFSTKFVFHFTIDDAAISAAYARHIGRGFGPVAAPGTAVIEGYSNPSWVALLALVDIVGLNTIRVSKWLGIVFGFLALLMGLIAVQLAQRRKFYAVRCSDLLLVGLIGLSPEIVVWLASGLENGLLAFLLVAVALMDAHEADTKRCFPWSSVVALVLAVTRPEGAVYGATIGGLKLCHAIVSREHRRSFWQFAVVFTVGLGAYHIVHWFVFHMPWANTYYAKVPGFTDEKLKAGWEYYKNGIAESHWKYVLPLAVLGLFRNMRHTIAHLLFAMLAFGFTCFSGSDWMPHYRFVSIGLPNIAILTMLGLHNVASIFGMLEKRRWYNPEFLAIPLAVVAAFSWYRYQFPRLKMIKRDAWCHYCNRAVDINTIQRVQRGLALPIASIVTHDFGAPSWKSSLSFTPIDYLGLCDHTVARTRILRDRDYLPAKADRILYQYLFHEQDRTPTFFFIPPNWWPNFLESVEFTDSYYSLELAPLDTVRSFERLPLAIHRGALVDYFPPIRQFINQSLNDDIVLLGADVEGHLMPGNEVTVSLALLPTRTPLSKPITLCTRLGPEQLPRCMGLFSHFSELLEQWTPGEPYLVEHQLTVSNVSTEQLTLDVCILDDHYACSWRQIRKLPHGKVFEPIDRPTHRYPRELPEARSHKLMEMQQRVHELLYERVRNRDVTLADANLAYELESEGQRLLQMNERDQAYLAFVLASQANRREYVRWYKALWDLRPLDSNSRFVMELALLKHAYRDPKGLGMWRLAQFYLSIGAHKEARYFAQRAIAKPPVTCDEGKVPLDCMPLMNVLEDFEGNSIPAGWHTEPSADETLFHVRGVNHNEEPIIRGHHGRHMLSSLNGTPQQHKASIVSVPFELGGAVSFLVGGSYNNAAVQIIVDDEEVAFAQTTGSNQLRAFVLDTGEFRGRKGVIRVNSQANRHVLFDWVIVWP